MSHAKLSPDRTNRPRHRSGSALWTIALLVGALLLLDVLSYCIAESLWFAEVNGLQVFWLQLKTRLALAVVGFGVSAAVLLGNLAIADRHLWTAPPPDALRLAGSLKLRWLLPLTLALSLVLALMLFDYGQVTIAHWHLNLDQRLPATLPAPFNWATLAHLIRAAWADEAGQRVMRLAGGGLTIAALLIYPQWVLPTIAVGLSLSWALVLSQHWATVLPYLYGVSFQRSDAVFDRNLSFYIFQLPVWELIEFWLFGLLGVGFIAVLLVYLLSGNSLSQGRFPGFSVPQQRHLLALGSSFMLVLALSQWLDRYRLLYSPTGAVYGASYTSVTVELPLRTIFSVLALAIALVLLQQAMSVTVRDSQTGSPPRLQRLLRLLLLCGCVAVAAGFLLPIAVQQLVVQPNELMREQPYMQRTIAATREAFGLNEIEEESFDPTDDLTYADLQRNALTVRNIRLWDTRPLLETNRQLQRFRPYYEFPGADIDRYTLSTDTGRAEQQQVLIAARELNYSTVPADAKTWVNEHLIYTHGYGFTLSPVNIVGEGGLPDYFIRGIEHTASSDRIRDSIPIGQPRIYYGEITNTYVMTQTRVRELDYPSGSDNIYNTYDGRGGVAIDRFWKRLLFAKHLRDWQMLFTQDFTPRTHLLFRRQIDRRVRTIAPFLRYDSNPYLVVADVEGQRDDRTDSAAVRPPTANTLYWIIDAYTTSERYPYSDPGSNDFNYIRNSVKVVVDAYHGTVSFYIADPQDPIIQTWNRIFPGLFQPLSAMPIALRTHLRYPEDFYRVQSEQFMVYHMTDPQVFYNREDQWRAPNEIYGGEARQVEPYYLIMKLPNESSEEFLLFRPFTPDQRTNLIAWLAARSTVDRRDLAADATPSRMLLYRFSKQKLVYGTEQLEARINQDPIISQQISLWNRQGSRAIQGNLLVIPIENSLLYVEPLYLEAEQNQLPTLVRVIVAYGNRIVMAETLEQALAAVFQTEETLTPAIVRPVEEALPQ
jgi:hypothetical protein